MDGSKKRKLMALLMCFLCIATMGFAGAGLEATHAEVTATASNRDADAPQGSGDKQAARETPETTPVETQTTASAPKSEAPDAPGMAALAPAPATDETENTQTPTPTEASDGNEQNAVGNGKIDEKQNEVGSSEGATDKQDGDTGEIGDAGGDVPELRESDEAEWPQDGEETTPEDGVEGLPNEGLHQADDATEIIPVITLEGSVQGDVLTEGVPVIIRAEISGVPDGVGYDLQWQNNRDGAFLDVPDETGMYVTFTATKQNVQWAWRLIVTLHDTDEAA